MMLIFFMATSIAFVSCDASQEKEMELDSLHEQLISVLEEKETAVETRYNSGTATHLLLLNASVEVLEAKISATSDRKAKLDFAKQLVKSHGDRVSFATKGVESGVFDVVESLDIKADYLRAQILLNQLEK